MAGHSAGAFALRVRQNVRRGNLLPIVCASENEKRPGRLNGLAIWLKLSAGKQPPVEGYFVYPVVAVEPVLIVSFFCAQAPRLNAPAATATIMITFTKFTINSPPSLAGCCRLFRRGCRLAQRISQAFFKPRS